MYLVDMLFVFAGFGYLLKKHSIKFLFMLGLCSTTFVPNFLNLQGTTFSIRTVILFPVLTIVSGIGIWSIFEIIRNVNFRRIYILLVVFIYSVSLANFVWIYFGRLPVERSEGWFLSDRVLAKYVFLTKQLNPETKIIVVSPSPKQLFYRYLFYNSEYQIKDQILQLNQKMADRNYQIKNITITDKCPKKLDFKSNLYLIDTASNCNFGKYKTSIKSIKDGGDRYLISNNKLCNQYPKRKYPLIKNVNLLNIEQLSLETYCTNYINEN